MSCSGSALQNSGLACISHRLTKNERDRASEVQIAHGCLGDRRVLFVADHGVRHLAVEAVSGFAEGCCVLPPHVRAGGARHNE
jgi:hypothetical protein